MIIDINLIVSITLAIVLAEIIKKLIIDKYLSNRAIRGEYGSSSDSSLSNHIREHGTTKGYELKGKAS